MQLSRRRVLATAPATLTGFSLLPFLVKASPALALQIAPSPDIRPVPPPLSATVVNAAKSSTANLVSLTQQRTATSVDISTSHESLSTLFSYMQENGWTAAANSDLNDTVIPENTVNAAHQASLISQLQAVGIDMSTSEAQDALNPATSAYTQCTEQLSSIGLAGIEANTLAALLSTVPAVYSPQDARAHLMNAVLTDLRQPHLRNVNCALMAIVCGVLGLFSPPPIDFIMGALAVYYGVAALTGSC